MNARGLISASAIVLVFSLADIYVYLKKKKCEQLFMTPLSNLITLSFL